MEKEEFNKLIAEKNNPDGIAFVELYKFLFPKIVIHIIKKYKNRTLGEDIAHNFFHKLLKMEIKEEIEKPLCWAYTVSDNLAKDFFKSEEIHNAYLPDESSYDPNAKILLEEYLKLIDTNLDPQSSEIIKMCVLEGFDLKEIAEILEMNYNTVRQKYSRGMKKLRKIFKDNGFR